MASVPHPGYYHIRTPSFQYPQQPVANGTYKTENTYCNVPSSMYPQLQYPQISQQQLQQQQQQQQQQLQLYYPPTSNTFPLDAILFYDDNKPYYEFTNFARIGFSIDGDYWPTSEHYFQAQKFEGYPKIQNELRYLFGARDTFEFVRKPENKPVNIIVYLVHTRI